MIALVLMINMSLDSSRRAGRNLINAVSLYTDLLNTDTTLSTKEVKAILEQFSGEYFGWDNENINILLEELNSDPSAVESHILLQFITGYQQLIEERLQSFDTLLYFLGAGVIIQFIFLLVITHKAKLTGRQLRNSEEVLRLLSQEREKERLRISSFLHDSILQDIGSLLLTTEMNKASIAAGRLREISGSLRDLTYQIAPLQLNTTGLRDSLLELANDFQKRYGLKVSCIASGYKESFLDNKSRLVFYRIVQEALNNINKHAEAENVQIKLVASHPYLILRIKDDGRGFTDIHTSNKDTGKHLGMLLMNEKAKSIGASLSGESVPGLGTTITLKYPIKKRG